MLFVQHSKVMQFDESFTKWGGKKLVTSLPWVCAWPPLAPALAHQHLFSCSADCEFPENTVIPKNYNTAFRIHAHQCPEDTKHSFLVWQNTSKVQKAAESFIIHEGSVIWFVTPWCSRENWRLPPGTTVTLHESRCQMWWVFKWRDRWSYVNEAGRKQQAAFNKYFYFIYPEENLGLSMSCMH